jgi:hypothetical protein
VRHCAQQQLRLAELVAHAPLQLRDLRASGGIQMPSDGDDVRIAAESLMAHSLSL